MNKKFVTLTEPILDKQGRPLRPDNNRLRKKKDIDKTTFLRYFFGEDVKRSTQGTRKTSLINALAITLSKNYVNEFLQNDKNLEKVEDLNEHLGHEKVDNYLSRVVEALDLDPESKLSIIDLWPATTTLKSIKDLQKYIRDNRGRDINEITNEYLETVDESIGAMLEPLVENIKQIYNYYTIYII